MNTVDVVSPNGKYKKKFTVQESRSEFSIFGLIVLIFSITALGLSSFHTYNLVENEGILNKTFPLLLPISNSTTPMPVEGKFVYGYPLLALFTFIFFYWYVIRIVKIKFVVNYLG